MNYTDSSKNERVGKTIFFNGDMEVYCDGGFVGIADRKVSIGGVWYPFSGDDMIRDNGEALPIGGAGVELR